MNSDFFFSFFAEWNAKRKLISFEKMCENKCELTFIHRRAPYLADNGIYLYLYRTLRCLTHTQRTVYNLHLIYISHSRCERRWRRPTRFIEWVHFALGPLERRSHTAHTIAFSFQNDTLFLSGQLFLLLSLPSALRALDVAVAADVSCVRACGYFYF